LNALAFDTNDNQMLGVNSFWNDTVPRRPQDAGGTPFEVLVTPMNVDMEAALTDVGVENTWAIHQGNHSDVYRNAWYRGLLEFAYARLRHPGDDESPAPPPPATFNYRSIDRDFDIWGWHFAVQRDSVEFLTLKSVSCSSVTLQGSGVVTFTVPPSCGTAQTLTVDLGPSAPVDEQGGAGAVPVDGTTVTVPIPS
jgi:hypothetical protein